MKKGFTLIELMVVIVIIGLLASIALPRFSEITDTAKVAQVQGNLANLRTSVNMFMAATGEMPDLVGSEDELDNVKFEDIKFTKYYNKSKAPTTPAYKEVAEVNTIQAFTVGSSDFDWFEDGHERREERRDPGDPDNNLPIAPEPTPGEKGGWLYDISKGEMKANLDNNSYGQDTDWDEF